MQFVSHLHRRCAIPALVLTLFSLASPLTRAQEAAPALPSMPAKIDLQDGDTLVFLGDSITHQRLYTQYVEDFFYTRYPDRRINFHNAGIGGARAWDALQRVNRDVLDYNPRYVTILLGMNDGSYQPFNTEIFKTYQRDMTQLVAEIREGGATPILMSPTMFDARAARAGRRPRDENMLAEYNSVLAYYGRWLQNQAVDSGTGYVDMFGPLNDLTVEQREADPSFTMIRDAVHPDPPGQLVMAFAMIEDMGLRSALSNIRIQPMPNGNLKAFATGGKVANLKSSATQIEFDWTAKGLPWVVPSEAQLGSDLLKLGHKASREALEVHGLEPGRYEVIIDETVIGTYPNTALSRHIELQGNDKTPQYQQAMEVVMLNKKKNEGPVKQLRDAWRTFQGWARMSRDLKSRPADQRLAQQIATARQKLDGLESTIQEAEAAAREIENQIYKANQPETRHYVIRKVTTN